MRVIHVITRLIVGGAQENTVSTVLGLQQIKDVQVQLISGPSPGPEGSMADQFASHPEILRVLPSLIRPIHPWHDLRALSQLTQIFKRDAPDIVHTHSGKAGILGRLAAHRAAVPVIIHTIHGPSFGLFQRGAANSLFRAAEKHAARFTTHFVTVADAMRDQYLAAGIGTRSQYTRIFSGFNLKPFLTATNDPALRQHLGIAPGDLVVGKIARLFKLKGHEDLFAVAPALVQKFPNLKFLLVGDGVWRQKFENLARQSGLEKHFVFTGLVPPSEVARYVGIMDLLVHLSRREGLPRALPQALAAGKPVVAYDCDGSREICLDGQTGILVPAGNLAVLTLAVERLLGDAALRGEFGKRGQAIVAAEFSAETMVSKIDALYRKLLSPSRR